MKSINLFSSAEAMYRGIAELLAVQPDAKVYVDGAFRVICVPAQPNGTPVILEPFYLVEQYYDVDVWEEHERWLVLADDGEHPNGYESLDEAMAAIREVRQNG